MEEKKGLFSGISRNILLLGIVSMLTDMSSEMITPIFPLFLQGLGATAVVIGLIGGLGDSVSAVVGLISGYSSDRRGRRIPYIFAGYGLSSLTKIGFAFATQEWHAILLKPVERIGKGLRGAPRDAIIAESKKEVRGKAFGIHRTLDSLGAILGSVIALGIVYFFLDAANPDQTYRNIFLVAGFIGFIALIPILLVKDVKREPQKRGLLLNLKLLSFDFKLFMVVATLFALGNFTNLLFILRSEEVFKVLSQDPKMAVAIPILLYIWYNLFNTVFSVPAGMLSDRFGRKTILGLGYVLFAATCIGFAFTFSLTEFIILFALYGIAIAFVDGTQRALASDLAPPENRGTALGTFYTLTAVAALPGSVFAGFFWDSYGPGTAFIYGAVLSVASIILLFIVRHEQRRER